MKSIDFTYRELNGDVSLCCPVEDLFGDKLACQEGQAFAVRFAATRQVAYGYLWSEGEDVQACVNMVPEEVMSTFRTALRGSSTETTGQLSIKWAVVLFDFRSGQQVHIDALRAAINGTWL